MIGRGRSRRPAVVLAVALLVAGACSAPVDSGPKTIREAAIPVGLRAETPSTTATSAPTGESEDVRVFYIGPEGRLVPVTRRVSPPVTVKKVLEKLFTVPTTAEGLQGLRTAISADTVVLRADVESRIVTVDVSKDFALGRIDDQISAYAQVVFTAVGVDDVRGVLFARNGRRFDVPDGDGKNTSTPLGPASYPQHTPR